MYPYYKKLPFNSCCFFFLQFTTLYIQSSNTKTVFFFCLFFVHISLQINSDDHHCLTMQILKQEINFTEKIATNKKKILLVIFFY
jgi:hypothetical protein